MEPRSPGIRAVCRAWTAGALALAALCLGGCATNPATGQSQLTLFTEAEEIELGLQADRELLQTYPEYTEDPALAAYVSGLGLAMAAQSERPDLPWAFRILDDETINALALPGGQIYVTRGLLAHLGRESELAGVLGHEIGHVTARHAIHGISRDLALSVAMVAGLVLLDAEDAEAVAGLGLQLLFLKFSRNQERQADGLAVRYAPRVGLDPYGAVDALRILAQVSAADGEGGFPTWLSTHPDPDNRWQRLAQEQGLEAVADAAALAADRERYVSRLDGLVLGTDPRNGVVDGRVYTHLRDGFRIAFPPGWTIERDGRSVVAASPDEDAAVLLQPSTEASVAAAEAALLAEEGVTTGPPWDENLGGLPARVIGFDADLDGTDVRGYAALVPLGGRVLEVIALSELSAFEERRHPLYDTIRSVRRLAAGETAAARPQRLRVVRLDRPASLRQLAPGAAAEDLARLALLNGVDPAAADEPLAAGRWVKLVGGT